MSVDSSFDAKERVRQAIDIVDLVGSYLQLRREGRAFKALCPWHDDTRPSLQINPERQSFKCFVCDIGGDIFTFIERMEGVGFREALAMLADRAGIRLQPARPDAAERPLADVDDKRVLYKAMDWATGEFHRCLLKAPEAAPAREYLAKRGISTESLARFRLGFSPDEWEWISASARSSPFSAAVLERIGLVVRKRSGPGYYDRFKGRVLFPIFDSQGRAVALGGRVLPELATAETAKYINSPETPLFTKSKHLYGLHTSREAIRKSNVALVMEGYTDCIIAHQLGFDNAVAVLGTALGADHIQLLRRFAERLRIVSVLDGDEAGRKRANEVLELFVGANADLRVLTLPDDLDPCDFLLKRGASSFADLVAGAADALEHAYRVATAGIDLHRDVHAASQALEQLLATIAKAPRLRSDTTMDDRLREQKFLQRLAFEFRLPEEQLRARLTQLRQKRPPLRSAPTADSSTASTAQSIDPCEQEVIEILLQFPAAFEKISQSVAAEQFTSAACRTVFAKCLELAAGGASPNFDRLLLEFDDPQIKTLLIAADEQGRLKANSEFDIRIRDVLARFRQRQEEPTRRAQKAALQTTTDPDAKLAILLEIQQRERIRQGISGPTDG